MWRQQQVAILSNEGHFRLSYQIKLVESMLGRLAFGLTEAATKVSEGQLANALVVTDREYAFQKPLHGLALTCVVE